MIKQAPHGVRRLYDGKVETHLLYEDELGRMVPLVDQHGDPVNFERKPKAFKRAGNVMQRMDKNEI